MFVYIMFNVVFLLIVYYDAIHAHKRRQMSFKANKGSISLSTGCVRKNMTLKILTVKKHFKTGLKLKDIHFKIFNIKYF